jgi:putative ABC transport system permease protein
MIPYSLTSTTLSAAEYEGKAVETYTGRVSDGFREVLGLELIEGRWFDDSDAALTRTSVVITQQLQTELFGEGSAVGEIVELGSRRSIGTPGKTKDEGVRVIGVVADFRRSGEFAGVDPVLFHRLELEDAETLNRNFPSHFLLKVRPGTPLALQERLAQRIESITTDLRIEFATLEQTRTAAFKWRLLPLWIGAGVAVLLLGMVGLSLLGVIWQNVTQRTTEIGLRRAVGGPVGKVQLQFVGELGVVTTIAVAIGAALILQFPLLDLMSFVSDGVYVASLGVAAVLIYLLATACALYPSLMATRITPSDALHYE